MSKRESINQEPLTIEELKTMAGLPVWCPEEEAYGIVMCDKIGQWAGIPFLHGVWYSDDDGVGVEFNHNIIGRKLKCFRVEDKKEKKGGDVNVVKKKAIRMGIVTVVMIVLGAAAAVWYKMYR